MIFKILAIAQNTFVETIRQPIYGIILIATSFLMILNNSLSAYTLDDDNMFLRDLGLSTLLVSGLFLAAFSAAGVITREIENKTVLTIISKPVSRVSLILGKFFGLISAVTLAFYLCTLAMLLVMRHEVMMNTTDPWDWPVLTFGFGAVVLTFVIAGIGNYWYGWQFSSTAVGIYTVLLTAASLIICFIDKEWQLQPPIPRQADQTIYATFLVLMMVWMITAVALAASCKLGQAATLTLCVIVLMLGLTSDYFFGQHILKQTTVDGTAVYEYRGLEDRDSLTAKLSWAAFHVVPNFGVFWTTDALTAGKRLSFTYVIGATGYALLFILAALLIGVAIFQKRELG